MEGERAVVEVLSTSDVAAATGYSVQQVRDLEAVGVIAPAVRAGNGYRRFTTAHVRDLRAYRELAHAVGPVEARRVMRELRTVATDEVVAAVFARHARLGHEREEARAARRALLAIRAESAHELEADPDGPADPATMTITELADALGVRTSTLRFWEQEGLLAPERIPTRAGSARRYRTPVIRDARITAALRSAGYPIPEVRAALTSIRDSGDCGAALEALEARLRDITGRMLALLRAGGVLAEIIRHHGLNRAG
ncbi:MerR family transcriptional regulator [Georgenia alba]|uniref:MerR family transcriptional regulator n=1 Tax=Georgenia alba TaxID=2233858 RepID=A0ABW2Q813_9MICO